VAETGDLVARDPLGDVYLRSSVHRPSSVGRRSVSSPVAVMIRF
jgi:hypothetical protein